jgi:hypothetical protein
VKPISNFAEPIPPSEGRAGGVCSGRRSRQPTPLCWRDIAARQLDEPRDIYRRPPVVESEPLTAPRREHRGRTKAHAQVATSDPSRRRGQAH